MTALECRISPAEVRRSIATTWDRLVAGLAARQQDQDCGGSEEDPYQERHGARYRSQENGDPDSGGDARRAETVTAGLSLQQIGGRERQDESDDRDPEDAGSIVLSQR